jgi:D-arabinose 1-dehydrogenase-like Zn-dependent alcohol dehydrogenase
VSTSPLRAHACKLGITGGRRLWRLRVLFACHRRARLKHQRHRDFDTIHPTRPPLPQRGKAPASAIDSLATGGRAVIVGAGRGSVTFDPLGLILHEQIITGSRHSTRAEFIETMNIMARGLVKPVIGKRVHFTEVETLLDDLKNQRLLGRGAATYE